MSTQHLGAIYARASVANERSTSGQAEELRARMEELGAHVPPEWMIIEEGDASASRYRSKDRAEWGTVIGLIESGRLRYLGCWELSRATRDDVEYARLKVACREYDTKLVTQRSVTDFRDPGQRLMADIQAHQAGGESDSTSERTRRGHRLAAAEGRPVGGVPCGYQRYRLPGRNTGSIQEVDPIAGPALQDAVKAILNGGSVTGEYKKFHALTGRISSSSVFRTMIRSPLYAGVRVHKVSPKYKTDKPEVHEYKAAWPALWSYATHRKLIQLLDNPDRRTVQDFRVKSIGTGSVKCGRCGAPVKRRSNNKGGVEPVYFCPRGHVSRRVWVVDEAIAQAATLVIYDLYSTAPAEPLNAEAEALADERARLLKVIEDSRKAVVAGSLTAESLAAIESDALKRIKAVDAELGRQSDQPEFEHHIDVLKGQHPLLLVRRAREEWDSLDLFEQRSRLREWLDVTMYKAPGRQWHDLASVDIQRRDGQPLTLPDLDAYEGLVLPPVGGGGDAGV